MRPDEIQVADHGCRRVFALLAEKTRPSLFAI
jgi:hypothetical protein